MLKKNRFGRMPTPKSRMNYHNVFHYIGKFNSIQKNRMYGNQTFMPDWTVFFLQRQNAYTRCRKRVGLTTETTCASNSRRFTEDPKTSPQANVQY